MVESGNPPVGEEQAIASEFPETAPRSRRKLFILLGIIAIAAVVSVGLFAFLPRGLGATIAYAPFSSAVGETRMYSTSLSLNALGQSVSGTESEVVEILGFDGENYTIKATGAIDIGSTSHDFSFTVKMNTLGEVVESSNLTAAEQEAFSLYSMISDSLRNAPGFGFFINKTETRVGESWQVPFTAGNSSLSITGTLNIKVGDIQNTTVPAGTFKTFKMEVSSDDLAATVNGVYASGNFNEQVHLEYGTGKLIDMNLHETVNAEGQSMTFTIQTSLTQDTSQTSS